MISYRTTPSLLLQSQVLFAYRNIIREIHIGAARFNRYV